MNRPHARLLLIQIIAMLAGQWAAARAVHADVDCTQAQLSGTSFPQDELTIETASFGTVRVMPRDVGSALAIYLVKDGKAVYRFPSFQASGWTFTTMNALAFRDVNGDGKKDVLVIAQGRPASPKTDSDKYLVLLNMDVYFQTDGGFTNCPAISKDLTDHVDELGNIAGLTAYLKKKYGHTPVCPQRKCAAEQAAAPPTPAAPQVDCSQAQLQGQRIPEQEFTLETKSFGAVKFVPTKAGLALRIYLVKDGKAVYRFPRSHQEESNRGFQKLEGVAFRDVNGDGRQDVLLIARDDEHSSTSVDIYFQTETGFTNCDVVSGDLNDHANKLTTLAELTAYAKKKFGNLAVCPQKKCPAREQVDSLP